jgi:quinolinate synthase
MAYDIVSEIKKIKAEKNALILAHYYETGDIQDVADFVGDSYQLAKEGQKSKADLIVLAGVVFMAESVKILNPTKKVVVPDLDAGCSLVYGSPFDAYLRWRKTYPKGIAVTYINSSAEVKAISDVIVTSSNAQKIIESIPADREILFGPDQHLGKWLARKYNRSMRFWPGACEVHVQFNAKKLHELIAQHPDAVVIAHPECDDSVLQLCSVVGSTSRLLEEVSKNPARKFIVGTETGIFHQMKKARPDVEIIQAPVLDSGCQCNDCPYMKLNSLEKILAALKNEKPEIVVAENIRKRAELSLQRMMDVAAGKPTTWPEEFVYREL